MGEFNKFEKIKEVSREILEKSTAPKPIIQTIKKDISVFLSFIKLSFSRFNDNILRIYEKFKNNKRFKKIKQLEIQNYKEDLINIWIKTKIIFADFKFDIKNKELLKEISDFEVELDITIMKSLTKINKYEMRFQ